MLSIESSVYYFEQGIPGFEHVHEFELMNIESDLPLRLMKSTGDEEVTMMLANPFVIYPEYEWDLSEVVKEELRIEEESDIQVWSIMTIPSDPANATINLLAPLVLNINHKVGKQLILHDYSYSSRAPLIRE